jgi:two-component system sensor histidine kinase/response regulator
VLINLVNNAIKFTEPGGEIEMNVSLVGLEGESGDMARLAFFVRDSGIGMSPEQLALLFQPFSQADGSTSRKFGGTGLGLSISQRLVELMGGSIEVTSDASVGSTFRFELVLPALSTTETGVVPAELNGARLLLVDDSRLARAALGHMLERLPVRFDAAATVEEAIVTLQGADNHDPYQIVIVDWQMPGLGDLQMARALHGEGLAHRPRFILVTAFGREVVETDDEIVRADAVLYKPITSSSLTDALVAALGGTQPPELLTDFGSLPLITGVQPFAGRRVLVADDNEVNVLIATELLKLAGLDADVAYDGHEAVRLALGAEPGRYALIFMDLEMPNMDGHAATLEIRRHPRLADTPIVALTAHAISEVRERCMGEGMQDYLTKPIYPEQLFELLARWLTPATADSEP